ncbi:hypothetical protein SETIT_9G420000v2 [Setaria italica]|uniref:Nuclease associated modular domain-containing protein n=4 Tax=Setaria TaxID=4554 RepID=A0A368SRE8_SETIT|nr:hypothetical protein SETIT_9G420000v2 [Setaria italica]TKV96372.1 hypothetical protein SEVIR_9G423900v2 [Setaria viridis]
MAPQLQGGYWIFSGPRLQQMPPWPRSTDSSRPRLLRLVPTRRPCNGAVRVVADAGPALALALDGGADAVGIELLTEEQQEDVDERERLRRMRISQANKGNTPWNKGRKHSPETLQRIRERTRIAMQDPKVKKKLMNLGHAQSEETRVKISAGVRRGWSLRLQRLMVQDGCFVEWRDMVADAARKGFAGGVGLQWNSYKIITEQMRQEWLENHQKRRSMPRPRGGNRRAPKTPEQRRKIAEAIAAKWLDQEYRERVCSGIASYHGSSTGTKTPRKPRPAEEPGVKRETTKKKYLQARAVILEDSLGKGATVKRKKSATPYKDPMAGEKLEMLSKIRAQRAALEIEKKEAIKRARSLIAEAEKAADALETAAAMSPFAQASLIEARKLVTEARVSLECVDLEGPPENASDDTSEDSALLDYDHRLETQNESNVLEQENKPVNGIKFPPTNVNGIGFHFDESAFTGIKQLYQRIENSMERAFLLPSASSKIKAESTDHPGTLGEDAPRSAENAETREDCPPGTLEEDTPSSEEKYKMRWVRGRLVKVENEYEDPEI